MMEEINDWVEYGWNEGCGGRTFWGPCYLDKFSLLSRNSILVLDGREEGFNRWVRSSFICSTPVFGFVSP